jgi:hypothetical protein
MSKNYDYKDPLFMVTPKVFCPSCNNDDLKNKDKCPTCKGSGYNPINLNGMWYPSAGFLVCGGPSIKNIPYQRLRERGIVSLAVNNVASLVPVTSWCFSDPQNKFHHGLHLDPKCMTFAPIPKLRHHVVAKLPNKKFQQMDTRLRNCPTTFGFFRKTIFDAENFLATDYAHWGRGGNQPKDDKEFKCLCTMLIGFRLMHYLGCPKIYLLGVDLWMTDEQPYAFQQSKRARNGRYSHENEYLRELKPTFDKCGFEVYNCNKESKCDVFDYVPFEEALEDCRGGVPQEPFDTDKWYDKDIQEIDIKENGRTINVNELSKIQREAQKTTAS